MRTLVLPVLLFIFSFQSHALTMSSCEVTAFEKSAKAPSAWTKTVFLSSDFQNVVDFRSTSGGTELKLVADREGNLNGWVNGQYKFILEGNLLSGRFESARHSGTISCKEPKSVRHLLQFKPWNQFYSIDPNYNENQILKSVSRDSIRYGYVCYIGDVGDAREAISDKIGLNGAVVDGDRIDFSYVSKDCVRGHGSHDDWECDEYKDQTVTASVPSCYPSRGDDR